MRRMIFLMLALSMVLAWGCAKKEVQSEPEPVVEEQPVVEEEPMVEEQPAEEPAEMTDMEKFMQYYESFPTTHTVVKGECLWWISEYATIYNDPFMWPLIYKANRDKVSNPDLIYPGQVLEIPRFGMELDEVKQARKQAGAAWSDLAPKADAVLPADIRQELGYGLEMQ